jgi:hypothetical protein
VNLSKFKDAMVSLAAISIVALAIFSLTSTNTEADTVQVHSGVTASDIVLASAQRNEALAVGFNYDSGFSYKFDLANAATVTKDVIDAFNSTDYQLRSVTIYSTETVKCTYNGTTINSDDGTGSFFDILPGGKSMTWDFTNVDDILFDNTGFSGNTTTIYLYVRTMTVKS